MSAPIQPKGPLAGGGQPGMQGRQTVRVTGPAAGVKSDITMDSLIADRGLPATLDIIETMV